MSGMHAVSGVKEAIQCIQDAIPEIYKIYKMNGWFYGVPGGSEAQEAHNTATILLLGPLFIQPCTKEFVGPWLPVFSWSGSLERRIASDSSRGRQAVNHPFGTLSQRT